MSSSAKNVSGHFWLIKFAPFRTSWADIVRAGTFTLRGVRSAEARNNLAAMSIGDPVLFYHSQRELAVVGVLEVVRTAYPDPTSADSQWLTCDFAPVHTFANPVSLAKLKADPLFSGVALIKRPRLAVQSVSAVHFRSISSMEGAFAF